MIVLNSLAIFTTKLYYTIGFEILLAGMIGKLITDPGQEVYLPKLRKIKIETVFEKRMA